MIEPWSPKEAVNVQWMECGESCPRGWEEVEKEVSDDSTGGPENLKTHNLAERYLLHFEANPNESIVAKQKACAEMVKDDPDLKDEFERQNPCYYGINHLGQPQVHIPETLNNDADNFWYKAQEQKNNNVENEISAIQEIPGLSNAERDRKIEEAKDKHTNNLYETFREYITDKCTEEVAKSKDDWCTWCNLRAHELREDRSGKGCGDFDKEGNQKKCKRLNATDVRNVDTTKWFGRGPFCRGRCPNKWIPLRYTKQGISGGNTLQRLPCWLGQKVECGRINSSTCEDVDCSFDNKNEPDCLQCSQCWWNSSNSECHPKSPSIDEDTKKCADELFDLGFPKRAATLLNKNTACRSYQEKETALAQCRRDIKGKGKERKRKEKEERKRKEKEENKRCEDFENALSDFKDTNKNFEDEFIRSHSNQNRKLDLIRRQLREAGLSLLKNIEPLTDEFRNLSCNSKIVIGETYEEIIKPTIETLIKIWRKVIVIFDRVDVQDNIDNYRKQILEKRNKITSIEKKGKLSRKKKRKVKKINEEIKKMKAEIKQPNQRYGKLPPSFDSYVMNIMGESKAIADEIKENITEKIRDEYRDAIPLHALSQGILQHTLDETLNFLNFVQNQSKRPIKYYPRFDP